MLVVDVYNHRFHKIFSPNESLTQIMDRDDIFVFVLSMSSLLLVANLNSMYFQTSTALQCMC